MVEKVAALRPEEVEELEQCERVIRSGLDTFVEVGEALIRVRDRRLYREQSQTFETYCRDRWQLSYERARQLMAASRVVGNLKTPTTVGVLPNRERQVRPLLELEDDEERQQAWAAAVASAAGQPTAARVAEAVQAVKNGDLPPIRPAAELVAKPSITGRGRELEMVETRPAAKKATFNETNDKVSWARWTWNPVTGCLHDCPYCYARDIAVRFYPQGFKPTFHADRLEAPRNSPVPKSDNPKDRRVFTCSMADLFGNWVPQEWIDAVFAQMRDNPQWEYLCLTKFPQRLASLEWPDNAWMGTTVDRQYRVDIAEKAFRNVKAGVKWLSCEPMLEPLKFTSLEMFDWVVIGGASRSSQTEESWPEFEWVVDLYNQARAAGCGVWIKPNGIGDRTRRPQEMPR